MSRSFAVLRRSFVLCGIAAITACNRDRTVTVRADTIVDVTGVFDGKKVQVNVRGEKTPIVGNYRVTDSGLQFRPAFPFDSGREYMVVVDARDHSIVHRFSLAASRARSDTRVTGVFPSGDSLPENQLRLYIQFSAPMSRAGGLPYVHLLDPEGNEVKHAFLPIEAEFWNREHTRYTLFLDPGRVKRGILPNEQLGRALVAGRRYSLVVDSTWRDGNGQPLAAPFVKLFRAVAADYKPIRIEAWRVTAPRAGTTEPVVIHFNEPLDFGLLQRAVGIEREDGTSIDGEVTVAAAEREWRFVPAQPWVAGDHRVLVLDFLEDLAGNRVNRAFEVDMFTHADSTAKPPRYTIPFRIR